MTKENVVKKVSELTNRQLSAALQRACKSDSNFIGIYCTGTATEMVKRHFKGRREIDFFVSFLTLQEFLRSLNSNMTCQQMFEEASKNGYRMQLWQQVFPGEQCDFENLISEQGRGVIDCTINGNRDKIYFIDSITLPTVQVCRYNSYETVR
uniref:Uncharacterized protein n=1 Tax=Romanomermis culicivorax TaxID=13658 RepID=A0A915J404_ROMCU